MLAVTKTPFPVQLIALLGSGIQLLALSSSTLHISSKRLTGKEEDKKRRSRGGAPLIFRPN